MGAAKILNSDSIRLCDQRESVSGSVDCTHYPILPKSRIFGFAIVFL